MKIRTQEAWKVGSAKISEMGLDDYSLIHACANLKRGIYTFLVKNEVTNGTFVVDVDEKDLQNEI